MSLYEPSTSSTQSLYSAILLMGLLSLPLYVPSSNYNSETGQGFPNYFIGGNLDENGSSIPSSLSEILKNIDKSIAKILQYFGLFTLISSSVNEGPIQINFETDMSSSQENFVNPDSSPNSNSESDDLNLVESQSTDGTPTYVLEGKDVAVFSESSKIVGGLGFTDRVNAKVIPAS